MKVRAVVCDIYKTLLHVGPPPEDADQRWEHLCQDLPVTAGRPTLAELAANAGQIIVREHASAKAAGVPHPEIFWSAVACEAWPALAGLDAPALDAFLFRHAQLQRTVRLMPDAAELLREFSRRELVLGLVSNSQPYTLHEVDAALSGEGLSRALFAADLSLLSFELGFSKPDPHVFRVLVARLARRGLGPGETLVVGDREDNDIVPARAQGFQTWRLTSEPCADGGGDWAALGRALGQS